MESATFLTRLAASQHPVILDIWAPWCEPCKFTNAQIERLGEEYKGRVDVWKMNADEEMPLLAALRVYHLPTVIAFHGLDEVTRLNGAQPLNKLQRLFDLALAGQLPKKAGLDSLDRFIRIAAGLVIFALGYFASRNMVLMGLAVFLFFYAVYDRLPVIGPLFSKANPVALPLTGKPEEKS